MRAKIELDAMLAKFAWDCGPLRRASSESRKNAQVKWGRGGGRGRRGDEEWPASLQPLQLETHCTMMKKVMRYQRSLSSKCKSVCLGVHVNMTKTLSTNFYGFFKKIYNSCESAKSKKFNENSASQKIKIKIVNSYKFSVMCRRALKMSENWKK